MHLFDHKKYSAPPRVELPRRKWPERVIREAPIWASVDLRDGNQALLEPMGVVQKRKLWELLIKLGFKEIEVGFPSASQVDYDFVRWLIEEEQVPEDVTIQVLVSAQEELIRRTIESLAGARQAIVHVYNSTSKVQRERVFRMSRAQIRDIAVRGASLIKQMTAEFQETRWTFQYSPESFTGTETDYALEVCEAVIDVWQPTPEQPCIINLPATVEMATPNVFADQVEYFSTRVKKRDSIVLSVHTHNDRGGAVAAAELARLAGADRVEGTLLGNGERTGNMDIVTMAMNLYSTGISPQLDLSNPDEIVRVYTEATGMSIHPRHPWFGELVYTAFSGSHQDAIRKSLSMQQEDEPWQVAYLPIDPRDIGRDYQAVVRVNSQSGKGGIAFVLERDFGFKLPRWVQIELAQPVQRLSEEQGEVEPQQIRDVFLRHFVRDTDPVALKGYSIRRGENDVLEAEIEGGGKSWQLRGTGDGALAAFVHGWSLHSGQCVHILNYCQHAMNEGTNADAVSYVQLNVDGLRSTGVAIGADTVGVALRAVVAALNRAAQQAETDVSSPPSARNAIALSATDERATRG